MSTGLEPPEERFLAACVDLVGRSGATGWQIRFSEDDDGPGPVVWLAVALFSDDRWEAAAAGSPIVAAYRLVERLVDGGRCVRCRRPTVAEENYDRAVPGLLADLESEFCWRIYDPELGTFTVGCEMDAR